MNRNQTTTLTRKKKKRKSAGYDLTPVVAIIGILGLALTIYIAYRASLSDRKLFSVSLLALFGGLLFESFRVSDKKTVIALFVGSYFFSLFSFLPGKREQHYNFENHIQIWPYFLLVFFALAFAIAHKDKVTAKLTEGITLLLSLSFVYWIVDYGFTNYHNWFAITLLSIAFLFSALSIISALTYIHLSKGVRFTLSIWSTIILVVFAIDTFSVYLVIQTLKAQSICQRDFILGFNIFYWVSVLFTSCRIICCWLHSFPVGMVIIKMNLEKLKKTILTGIQINKFQLGILCFASYIRGQFIG